MEQATFAELEHDWKKRRTRRELFLDEDGRAGSLGKLSRPGGAVLSEARPRPYPLGTTTILKFRHLPEARVLGEGLFEAINAHLADEGHSLRQGTMPPSSILTVIDTSGLGDNPARQLAAKRVHAHVFMSKYMTGTSRWPIMSTAALDCSSGM